METLSVIELRPFWKTRTKYVLGCLYQDSTHKHDDFSHTFVMLRMGMYEINTRETDMMLNTMIFFGHIQKTSAMEIDSKI